MAQGYLARKSFGRKILNVFISLSFINTKLFLKSESLILFEFNRLITKRDDYFVHDDFLKYFYYDKKK